MEVQRKTVPVKKASKNGFLKSILVFTLIVSFSVSLFGRLLDLQRTCTKTC